MYKCASAGTRVDVGNCLCLLGRFYGYSSLADGIKPFSCKLILPDFILYVHVDLIQ